jgi:hypothetical protein
MPKPTIGKIGVAPCGHRGEHLTTNYVQCLEGCEENSDDFPSFEVCSRCGSMDIDDEYEIDQAYKVWNPGTPDYNRRCFACGSIWISS